MGAGGARRATKEGIRGGWKVVFCWTYRRPDVIARDGGDGGVLSLEDGVALESKATVITKVAAERLHSHQQHARDISSDIYEVMNYGVSVPKLNPTHQVPKSKLSLRKTSPPSTAKSNAGWNELQRRHGAGQIVHGDIRLLVGLLFSR